jgi:hypothetical protein
VKWPRDKTASSLFLVCLFSPIHTENGSWRKTFQELQRILKKGNDLVGQRHFRVFDAAVGTSPDGGQSGGVLRPYRDEGPVDLIDSQQRDLSAAGR